jgi:hypothetical protein
MAVACPTVFVKFSIVLPRIAVAALVLAFGLVSRAAAPLGQLKVKADGIEVAVPDPGIVFKVGRTANLFELRDDLLLIALPQGEGGLICAVRWSAQEAPAWISNERVVTFGKIATSVAGTIRLEPGEVMPVTAMGPQDYRVQITRFGRTASLDIPRSTEGLGFELASAPAVTPVKTEPTEKPVAPKPPTTRPRIIIEGAGDLVVIRTNDATSATSTPLQPATAVPTEVLPVTTAATPAAAVTESSAAEQSTPAKKAPSFKLPLILRDTQSLVIIFIFVALIVIFLLIQRKMIQRKSDAANPPPQKPAEPAPVSPMGLKLKKDAREGAAKAAALGRSTMAGVRATLRANNRSPSSSSPRKRTRP